MLSVLKSEIQELKDSVSFAGSESASPFGDRENYFEQLDSDIKMKIQKKIMLGPEVHSVQNIKAENGIFFYGNKSDGYIYLSGPMIYLSQDEKELEVYYDGNTRINPLVLTNFFLVALDQRIDIFSLSSGKKIRSFKNIRKYRGFSGTKPNP